ncbi:HPr family phosphocarrier protein [Blautia hansenii]|uniref:HPr family phosphocarrier protein n=1 Tax=Blautia hansenii TaxID=1322 RepID=UPI0022E98339|nr:HPr family phosphocarrier protein [Blautia hansenii]
MNNIFKIKLNSVNNAALFVKQCGEFEEDIDYIHGRYVIDAKSIMGIMSTDLGESAKVEIHTDNIEIITKFKEEISLWMEDK